MINSEDGPWASRHVGTDKGPKLSSEDLDTAAAAGAGASAATTAAPPPPPQYPSSKPGLLARLRRLEARLDKKLGIESDAVERKRAEDREHVPWHGQLSMALLWASGTMNTSCFATGFLGRELGLDLRQSVAVTILASLAGGTLVGAAATFGAATGLRQMSVSRFSFGWWPSKAIAVLNAVQQLGWAAVSCITGGLALTAVSDGRVSLAVGIVILAVAAWLVSVVGLNAILVYERYAWIVFFLIFLVILGETGRYADGATRATAEWPADLAGAVLSLGAIVYGSSASWATVASDYYVHYHADVSRVRVFVLTTLGIAVPTSIGMVAGCVVSSALNVRPDWEAAYAQGLGYVIQAALYPRGLAKLLLALLVLSGVNTNVIGIYSAALSLQQIARPLALVPRLVWMGASLACILGLALGGRGRLNEYLQSFLSLLGYWSTSYVVVVVEEHYVFRGGSFAEYDLEGWNTPGRLPVGIGAAVAFGLGVVAWCMGMRQTWFVGPLARLIGKEGGDVANELTFIVTALSYPVVRYLEVRSFGR